MTTVIEYNGHTLDLTPKGGLQIARDVLDEGKAALLVYEPGDATRYMLIVAPIVTMNRRTGWLVSRCDGGYEPFGAQVGAVALEHCSLAFYEPGDFWPLSNKNSHTAYVLCNVVRVLLESYA